MRRRRCRPHAFWTKRDSWWSPSARRQCPPAHRACALPSRHGIPTPRSSASPTSCEAASSRASRLAEPSPCGSHRMSAIFVTATGTGVGKTFVTAGLIRHHLRLGRAVDSIKPVVSGFDPAALPASDPGVLLAALGRPLTIEEASRISPWRFAAPLSPDLAAAREGRAIDFNAVVDFCQDAIAARRDRLFIEGIGGIMVPLDAIRTVLDLITALRLPLILVAGSYVGTISHTLTALQVLVRRNLDVAAVVVSASEGSAAALDETVTAIARFADSIDVIGLPRLADAGEDAFERIAELV